MRAGTMFEPLKYKGSRRMLGRARQRPMNISFDAMENPLDTDTQLQRLILPRSISGPPNALNERRDC